MASFEFVQDAVFQLNLVVWLSWPSHPTATTIFYDNGYSVARLSQDIPVPVTARLKARATSPKLNMKSTVSSDVLLSNTQRQQFLSIECKVSSFGAASSTAAQTVGQLACIGSEIASTIGLASATSWTAIPLYAVSYPEQVMMAKTLETLEANLAGIGIITNPVPASAFGIQVDTDGVYLHFCNPEYLPFLHSAVVKVRSYAVGGGSARLSA